MTIMLDRRTNRETGMTEKRSKQPSPNFQVEDQLIITAHSHSHSQQQQQQQQIDNVDAQLAQELNQMSVEERNQVFYDIHGVSDAIPKPQQLHKLLSDFEIEIGRIKRKFAYNQAHPQYVQQPSLRLKFLESELYNPKLAAQKFIKFMNRKFELFGQVGLNRDITLNDFQGEDLDCLQSGIVQVLPCTDQGGRYIICLLPIVKIHDRFSLDSMMRTYFYVAMSAVLTLPDDIRRRGMVKIAYNLGPNRSNDPRLIRRTAQLRKALPLRTVGAHLCFDDVLLNGMVSLVKFVIGKNERARFRSHYGKTKQESLQCLQTFGVPPNLIPVSDDHTVDTTQHLQWLQRLQLLEIKKQQQQQQDEQHEKQDHFNSNSIVHDTTSLSLPSRQDRHVHQQDGGGDGDDDDVDVAATAATDEVTSDNSLCTCNNEPSATDTRIDMPRYYDVLFGRGKTISAHPGNVRLHCIMKVYFDRYEKAKKLEKSNIAQEIVSIIHNSSGRFLRQDTLQKHWIPVPHDEAREKVARTFRNRRAALMDKSTSSSLPPPKINNNVVVDSTTTTTTTIGTDSSTSTSVSSSTWTQKSQEKNSIFISAEHKSTTCVGKNNNKKSNGSISNLSMVSPTPPLLVGEADMDENKNHNNNNNNNNNDVDDEFDSIFDGDDDGDNSGGNVVENHHLEADSKRLRTNNNNNDFSSSPSRQTDAIAADSYHVYSWF